MVHATILYFCCKESHLNSKVDRSILRVFVLLPGQEVQTLVITEIFDILLV
jgi:hypothetical protein